MSKLILLDAGHGGIDPKTGFYLTAPDKMHKHPWGRPEQFHGDGYFYEGVWNRMMCRRIESALDELNIPYRLLHHEYLDLSLEYRSSIANHYATYYGPKNCFVISLHANGSSSRQGRGYEIYTSPRPTASDYLAEVHYHLVEQFLGDRIKMRSDTTDGDHDKEARFWILTQTAMPAVLIEHLFFDNYQDAKLLFDQEVITYFVESTVLMIEHFLKT